MEMSGDQRRLSGIGSEDTTFSVPPPPKQILVYPETLLNKLSPFLAVLAEQLPATFQAASDLLDCEGKPAILAGFTRIEAERLARTGSSIFLIEPSHSSPAAQFYFTASGLLPAFLALKEMGETRLSALLDPLPENGEILAQRDHDPLWIRSRTGKGTLDIISLPVEEMTAPNPNGSREFRLRRIHWTPLVLWLKSLAGHNDAPIAACLLIEDANFKRSRYGFLQFARLLEQAEKNGYHTAFASIPLDGGRFDADTVGLLQSGHVRASLVAHGNNHASLEFAEPEDEDEAVRIAAQCAVRVRALETSSGLCVGKIFVPPDDACNELMMDAMVRVGFEAACMSSHRLAETHADQSWAGTVGFRSCEILQNLPILPRFEIGPFFKIDAVLAVVFGQPVIAWGRHDLFAFGTDLVDEAAAFIDSLGAVTWTDLPTLQLSHFRGSQSGSRLQLEMISRRIRVRVPLDANTLSIHRRTTDRPWREPVHLQARGAGPRILPGSELQSIAVEPDSEIELLALSTRPIASEQLPAHPTSAFAVMARRIGEMRDRIRPVTSRLLGGRRRITLG